MCQCRFAKAQIIGMVKEQEAGMPTAEVCLRRGLGPASSDKFKAKYGLITDLIDWIKGITF
jgi:putative transposase